MPVIKCIGVVSYIYTDRDQKDVYDRENNMFPRVSRDLARRIIRKVGKRKIPLYIEHVKDRNVGYVDTFSIVNNVAMLVPVDNNGVPFAETDTNRCSYGNIERRVRVKGSVLTATYVIDNEAFIASLQDVIKERVAVLGRESYVSSDGFVADTTTCYGASIQPLSDVTDVTALLALQNIIPGLSLTHIDHHPYDVVDLSICSVGKRDGAIIMSAEYEANTPGNIDSYVADRVQFPITLGALQTVGNANIVARKIPSDFAALQLPVGNLEHAYRRRSVRTDNDDAMSQQPQQQQLVHYNPDGRNAQMLPTASYVGDGRSQQQQLVDMQYLAQQQNISAIVRTEMRRNRKRENRGRRSTATNSDEEADDYYDGGVEDADDDEDVPRRRMKKRRRVWSDYHTGYTAPPPYYALLPPPPTTMYGPQYHADGSPRVDTQGFLIPAPPRSQYVHQQQQQRQDGDRSQALPLDVPSTSNRTVEDAQRTHLEMMTSLVQQNADQNNKLLTIFASRGLGEAATPSLPHAIQDGEDQNDAEEEDGEEATRREDDHQQTQQQQTLSSSNSTSSSSVNNLQTANATSNQQRFTIPRIISSMQATPRRQQQQQQQPVRRSARTRRPAVRTPILIDDAAASTANTVQQSMRAGAGAAATSSSSSTTEALSEILTDVMSCL